MWSVVNMMASFVNEGSLVVSDAASSIVSEGEEVHWRYDRHVLYRL